MTKPYYDSGGVTIYNCDCRDILPHLKADVVVTDPPYGIGRDGQAASNGKHGGRKAYEHLGWDSSRPERSTFDSILAAAGTQIIWGGNYFADMLPASSGWLVWDKGQRISQSDGELAWTSMNAALRIFVQNRVALMMDGAVHPTQKPLSLILWCLGMAEGAVLDPFMGSGTTLVAAKQLGRRAIGIEIEERYCEVAAKRLEQGVLFGPQSPSRTPAIQSVLPTGD